MPTRPRAWLSLLLALCACGSDAAERNSLDRNSPGGLGEIRDGRVGIAPSISICAPNCEDFPAQPILDTEAGSAPPANAASLFGEADNMGSSGPCVLEPTLSEGDKPGSLF